jgi:hypothetical protein
MSEVLVNVNTSFYFEKVFIMLELTVKKSVNLRPGFGKKNILLPIGKKLFFYHYKHSYHSYYEVHSYKAKVLVNGEREDLSLTRIEGSSKYSVKGVYDITKEWSFHDDSNIYWSDLFEEDFPEEAEIV